MIRLRVTPADKWFSLYIRYRDDFTCQRCFAQYELSENMLDCSHFYSRAKKSVRFDPDNAVTLCKRCHMYFDGHTMFRQTSHKKEHENFMLTRLGERRFNSLFARAHMPSRIDEKLVAMRFEAEVKKMKTERMASKVKK